MLWGVYNINCWNGVDRLPIILLLLRNQTEHGGWTHPISVSFYTKSVLFVLPSKSTPYGVSLYISYLGIRMVWHLSLWDRIIFLLLGGSGWPCGGELTTRYGTIIASLTPFHLSKVCSTVPDISIISPIPLGRIQQRKYFYGNDKFNTIWLF